MKDPGRVLIIGAGPTGLGAAWRLRELGHHDVRIIDGRSGPGGLAASFVDDAGFTWDIGGHVQFSHYAYYDRVLDSLPIEWLHHERESWIWIRKRFVPYPFQNNIHRLDDADRDHALFGLERRIGTQASNFREWIKATFGDGIAEMFLFPYNLKVWAWPLETLGLRWMGERVAVPDLERIRRNIAENRDDVSWGPNTTFRFPLHGGTGAIWTEVARKLDRRMFVMGDPVVRVEEGRVHLGSGVTVEYDTVISTIPIKKLAGITQRLPAAAVSAAESLLHSSTHVFGIGLRGQRPENVGKKCWMYFPEANSPHYRVTVFSNYSPANAPPGCWSLMAEVAESPVKPVDRNAIFDDVIRALREDGLIGAGAEVVSRWHHREEFGYPTPSLHRDDALAAIQPELERRRIFSRGRFGAWKYEVSNQDHSFMQGVEVADRLTGEGDEPTVNRPDFANSGVFLRS